MSSHKALLFSTAHAIMKKSFTLNDQNKEQGEDININKGAVNSIVSIDIGGGNIITATISCAAVEELELKVGSDAYAVIKATSVMVGIDE